MIDFKNGDLKYLTDAQLVIDLKICVVKERSLLTEVLYHLKELDSRKLYSSLGYKSLYDYACMELKYSTDQAYRRIQAMRLLKELPEISKKIDSGALSLSNISQVQRFFKESNTTSKEQKIKVITQIENKSVRDVEKEILKLSPEKSLPLELKKQVTATHTNVNFIMSEDLEKKLEEIKSLLGTKAISMSLASLIETLADLASEKLKEKKFGKKTVKTINLDVQKDAMELSTETSKKHNTRYVSKPLKYKIWSKDNGRCRTCDSTHNLNLDHIQPLALGGKTDPQNLRLLCFNCNQRSRIEAKL